MIKYFNYIIMGALLAVIIFMRTCEKPSVVNDRPIIVTTTDTVMVEVPIPVITKVPSVTKYIPVDSAAILTMINVDTAAILRDYFSKRVYLDSIKLDSIGHVYVQDTISKNRIISRTTWGEYKYPVITNTTTITLPPVRKLQFYGGFQVQGPTIGLGPQITMKTKNDQLWQIGVALTPIGLNYNFGMGWKIKLRK